MQIANQMRTHCCSMLAGQSQPVQERLARMVSQPLYCAQAVPFAQQGEYFDDRQPIATHGFKERPLVGTEGLPAGSTAVAPLDIAVDHNVAGLYFPDIPALRIGTPLTFNFHGGSPPSQADDTPKGLSRLR